MSEEIIKVGHSVMVVLTTKVEFLTHEPSINGSEPKNTKVAAMQFQGGGIIVQNAWENAKRNNHHGRVVQELLKQAIERLPLEIVQAFGDLGEKAYNKELPSRIVAATPGQALALQGAEVKRLKPS